MRIPHSSLLLFVVTACAPPAVVYRPAADAVAAETDPLSVILRSGKQVTVRNARVVRDTLYGTAAERAGADTSGVVIPMADVERITRNERGLNTLGMGVVGLTSGMLLGMLAIVGLLMAAAY